MFKFDRKFSVAFVLVFSLFLLKSFKSFSAAPDGAVLFKGNCATCHSIGKGIVTGPDLAGVNKRHSEEWLHKWIKNSQSLVQAKDAEAVTIFDKFNHVIMPPQSVNDEEITAILGYIQAYIPPAKPKGPVGHEGPVVPEADHTLWYLLIGGFILLLIGGTLRRVQRSLAIAVAKKKGEPEPPLRTGWQHTWHWIRNNKKAVAIMLLIVVTWSSVEGWYTLKGIGVTTGYTPDQPIAFSHKIHAGDNQIACLYCHFGAAKGKTAGVPPANVCMNCHKAIKEGQTTGTEEIAKIYKALDYDPDKGTYGPNQKPLVWTRVHNLPDLAYFNHSQHVVVGKIQCQACHGPVETMTVASQYSPLTMGWCIDCHKRTPVQMAGNNYYTDYHNELLKKFGNDSLLTVESIGGTECARCHY